MMNRQNVVSQSSTLHNMVKVKKLRFKDSRDDSLPKPTRDVIQRKANFENFKEVYGDSLNRKSTSRVEVNDRLHKTKSGSLCRIPKVRSQPLYVETVNIELPLHFGADRAVQLIQNKIKPKKAAPKVSREVLTDNIKTRLKKIDEMDEPEESITDVTKKQMKDVQKQMNARKATIWKNLPRVALLKPRDNKRKQHGNQKVMNILSNINEKLEKMQQKYLNQPKIQYKSVNDCCTQSRQVEILYENQKYPEEVKISKEETIRAVQADLKERSTENMNKIFPEFPKIEDTLREIEAHLDNIVNLEGATETLENDSPIMVQGKFEGDVSGSYLEGDNFAEILARLERQYSPTLEANRILEDLEKTGHDKLQTIRKQIEVVEDFCDKMSEIANDTDDNDSDGASFSPVNGSKEDKGVKEKMKYFYETEKKQKVTFALNEDEKMTATKVAEVADFIEGPDLQSTIKKSNYLTKEFGSLDKYTYREYPMVKVFSSDNESTILWRKKLLELDDKEKTDFKDGQSVTKLVNNLKYTLENSLYEPVTF